MNIQILATAGIGGRTPLLPGERNVDAVRILRVLRTGAAS